MSDYIDRQAVLASIKNLYPDMPVMDIMGARQKWLEKYAPYFECENAVEQLPSVENKGEWIHILDSYYEDGSERESHWECSKCGSSRSGWGEFKFCPDCGADMRGE